MINAILDAHRSHLDNSFPSTDRLYADFRLIEYPDLGTGSPVYTLSHDDNLIDRGNCESTTPPMLLGETVPVLSNATFARSSDFVRSGDYSYKVTKTVAAGTESLVYLQDGTSTTDMHSLVAGQSYEVTAQVYIPAASGIQGNEINIQSYGRIPAGWGASGSTTAADTYDEWQTLSFVMTFATNVTGVLFRLNMESAAADTEYFYIDDIKVTGHVIPGSHYLSSGFLETLYELPDTLTIQIEFISGHAYDIASNQYIAGWYGDADSYLYIGYVAGVDMFSVGWRDNGTTRNLYSAQYDDGTTHRNIGGKHTITLALDLTTGTTAGSALWMDKTQDDTAWPGNIDVKATHFNLATFRRAMAATGANSILSVRMIPNYVATDADVQNDFKDVKNEEIFWCLDGHGTGRTRCNITRHLKTITTTREAENPVSGIQCANKVAFALHNLAGQFSDDQYAAFDPTADQFNGLVTQKYLQKRSNVTLENWYDGDFDTVFFGRLSSGGFARASQSQKYGVVACSADDYVGLIAQSTVRRGRYYENADLVDTATESDSLVHLIARLATQREIYNYAADSSFENATITDSWVSSGGTFTNPAGGLIGSKEASHVNATGTTQTFSATTLFTGGKTLSVGDTWNFSVWLKSAAAAAANIVLNEQDSVATNDSTSTAYSLAGGEGYVKYEVSHTITDSDSDRLQMQVQNADGCTVLADCVMLVNNDRAYNFFVDNTNDGSAGIISADDAVSDAYDLVGFDVQDVAITHPWRRVDPDISLWDYLKNIGDATVASYLGMSSCGTFKMRSRLATDYGDPVPMGTITTPKQNLSVALEQKAINRLMVRGVYISKREWEQILWDAVTSGSFDVAATGFLSDVVANGASWPPTATYGYEYIARYGFSGEIPTSADMGTRVPIDPNAGNADLVSFFLSLIPLATNNPETAAALESWITS